MQDGSNGVAMPVVLQKRGRESDDERILAYNIGISIQDIHFAKKIFERMENKEKESKKFWV